MKTNTMTAEQLEAWKKLWHPVRAASYAMGDALYILNRADTNGSGMSHKIAGEPFNLMQTAWNSMIMMQFGFEVEINWGGDTGGDTFAHDLKEAVRAEFLSRWASDEADDANSDAGAEAEALSIYGDAQ